MPRMKGLLLIAALCVCLLLLNAAPTQAASSSEIQNQINELQDQQSALQSQIADIESKLNANAEQIDEMIARKNAIDQQVSLIVSAIDNTQQQISAYTRLIADKQEELDAAEDKLAQLNMAYKTRIRAMEEDGDLSYWSVLFRSESFSDFLDRLNMIQEIANADRQRLQQIRDAAVVVSDAQKVLTGKKAELELVRQEQQAAEQKLQEKHEETAALLADLLASSDIFEDLLNQSELEQHKLMEEIAKLEDDYDDAVYQEWLATYVPPTTEPPKVPDVQTPPVNGEWLTPVPYYTLTSPFGMRLHPILGIYRMHDGVDMACDAWTPIYATRGGQVSIATNSSSAGLYVQINHGDGYRSVYMHMIHYTVSAGDFVAQGQIIGYVGNTGLSKGNHLHFGISYNGEYVNPMEYIK